MDRSTRKLVGSVAILAFVIVYAFLAASVGQHLIPHDSRWIELAYFVVAGLAWVLPVMPLMSWMEGRDRGDGRAR